MLDLPIRVFEEPLERKPYASSFQSPVVFFMTDKSDPRSTLVAFALCDFQRGRITYIVSSSPENLRRLEGLASPVLQRCFSPLPRGEFRQVHSAIEVVTGESFLAFVYASSPCGYFYHVDYKKKVLRVITPEDFQALAGCGPVDSFGATFDRDPRDPQSFFLNAKLLPADPQGSPAIAYFRVAMDLGSAALVGSRPCTADHPCPHATRRQGDYLLSSEFHQGGFELLKSRRQFATDAALREHILRDYWSHLDGGARAAAVARNVLGHPFTFFRTCKRAKRNPKDRRRVADLAIDRCFRGRHPTLQFVWAARDVEDYRFHVAPGCIRVLSLADGTETAHTVRHNTSAHFEIGASGYIYLSCHNFLMWDNRRYLIEPAAILRLGLSGGTVEERGVFQHPQGFRFVSHVMLQTRGREYLATVGQPNRLLLVDAQSMQLVAARDIGPDRLSSSADLPFYLSRTDLEADSIRCLAASEDGRYLAAGSNDAVTIVDTNSLDVVDTLPVASAACRLAGCPPGQIVNDGVHCQRLR